MLLKSLTTNYVFISYNACYFHYLIVHNTQIILGGWKPLIHYCGPNWKYWCIDVCDLSKSNIPVLSHLLREANYIQPEKNQR